MITQAPTTRPQAIAPTATERRTHSSSRLAFRGHCEYACALERHRAGYLLRDRLCWLVAIAIYVGAGWAIWG